MTPFTRLKNGFTKISVAKVLRGDRASVSGSLRCTSNRGWLRLFIQLKRRQTKRKPQHHQFSRALQRFSMTLCRTIKRESELENAFFFHSQLQKFCPQLILFILPLSAHSPVCSLALHLIIQQVMPDFLNKRSDEIYHVSAAPAKRKDIILLLLLGVRERQFGHLVQHGRQRHAQGWRLTAAQAHEHCSKREKENTSQ